MSESDGNSYFDPESVMNFELYKNAVECLLDDEKIPEALNLYTQVYRVDFLKTECLEVLVNGVVKIARRMLVKTKQFHFNSFMCFRCNDIIKDPVTLKCGHTFSKKCLLLKVRKDSFTCPKCGSSFSVAYLSQLQNNVVIMSLVEKLSERYLSKYRGNHLAAICQNTHDKAHGTDLYFQCRCDDALVFAVCPYAANLKACKILVDFVEAFKSYLVSYTVDHTCHFGKNGAIQVLYRVLTSNLCSSSGNQNPHPVGNSQHLNRQTFSGYSENSFRNSGSSDSLHVAEDDMSSSDEEEFPINLTSEYANLLVILNDYLEFVKKAAAERSILSKISRRDKERCLDKREFECPLCMRILWEPVTTTCGHTFCRVCLNRWFDHQPTCPMCKTSLDAFLAERVQNTTEFLERAIENLLPVEFSERKAIYLEELEELTNEDQIPLFVCTVALPTVSCPLHVFEPRYRLMIRQCMESGNPQFGMCGIVDDEIADYGTMLEIRDVKYFPDGRSIVDTIGRRRFRILRRGERDGYHTGAVEFLKDRPLSDLDSQSIKEKHDKTYKEARLWFTQLRIETRLQILEHFGNMPPVETDYSDSPNGPSWSWWLLAILPVENKLKVFVTSLTYLPQRLDMLYRILLHFKS